MLDFTAIDFETANGFRGSACSVGLAKVQGGELVDTRHWLIRPPEGFDRFEPFNVLLHGIRPDMVVDAPRFCEVLPHVMAFAGGDVLVAHNGAFDMGVIRDGCAASGVACPDVEFLCSLVLSRRLLPLPSYRLPFVAEALGIEFTDHHSALADATCAAKIIHAFASRHGARDVAELAAMAEVSIGQVSEGVYRGSVSMRRLAATVR